MLNKNTIKSVQDKILNSREFSGSQKNKKLLLFLIQSYLKNEIPKETTIALEVLERSKNFNSTDDPIVRVQMHTLRKKLESYYKSDGIDDKVRLQIPKGHYAIKFTTKSDKNDTESGQHPSKRNIIYTLSIIIILTTSSALIFGLWRNNIKIKKQIKVLPINR